MQALRAPNDGVLCRSVDDISHRHHIHLYGFLPMASPVACQNVDATAVRKVTGTPGQLGCRVAVD
jgi:hypothetical protein